MEPVGKRQSDGEKLRSISDDQQPRQRRLNYREKRELESLPAMIETLDAEVAELHERMAQPTFYKQVSAEIASTQVRLNDLQQQLATAYKRWEELEHVAE